MKLNKINLDKNAIRLKVGQTSTSSPTLNVDGNQLIKSEGTQIINTSGAQNLFNDSNLVDDYFLKGGYKVVSGITCRNNIPCEYRKLGMQVMVIGPDASFKRYILKGQDPCSNDNWEELIKKDFDILLTENYSSLDSTTEINTQKDLNNALVKTLIELRNTNGDKHFVFDQFDPKSTWEITHNMNKFPSVYIVDTANSVVEGLVEYIDKNSLTVTFNFPFSGKAYLN